MALVVQTIVNTLILSAVYVLLALGFAFILNMLGVFNIAHGAVFMAAGYGCYLLISKAGLPNWATYLVVVAVAAIFGIFLEKVCFRPFYRDFARQMMVCIAITVVLSTTMNIWLGTTQASIPTFVSGVAGSPPFSVRWDRIATFLVGAFVLIVVMLFVNRSRLGVQMRAVTQDLEGALLQGVSFTRVARTACIIGCALAAIAGICWGTMYSLSPYMGDNTLVKVLMVVILAGVGSFNGIFLIGLIMGALYSALPILVPGAASDLVAIAVVLLILVLRPTGLFGSEYEAAASGISAQTVQDAVARPAGPTRRWVKPAGITGVLVIVALLPLFLGGSYMLHVLILTFLYSIVAVSFRTVLISGQFSIAHAAFMGIGAYTAGICSKWLDLPPWLTLPLGGIVAMVISVIVSYPFARLRAVYYAMGSLFFGVMIVNVISTGGSLTGGYSGMSGVHPMFTGSKVPYYYLFLGIALVSFIALHRFEFSGVGVKLKAIAQSHVVASSVGINESRYKAICIGFCTFFVGVAGAAYAHYNMVLSPSSFSMGMSLWIVMYGLIGGSNSFYGPIIGTAFLLIVPEYFRVLQEYSPYISALILFIVVFWLPGGLVDLPRIVRVKLSEPLRQKVFARGRAGAGGQVD